MIVNPTDHARDPLHRMSVYRLSLDAMREGYADARRLAGDRLTAPIAGQLYRALGSVAANVAEGYSRSSGRDRARLYEYALGSVRESVVWYEAATPVLTAAVVATRQQSLIEVRSLLLAIIPRERRRSVGKVSF